MFSDLANLLTWKKMNLIQLARLVKACHKGHFVSYLPLRSALIDLQDFFWVKDGTFLGDLWANFDFASSISPGIPLQLKVLPLVQQAR